MYQTINESGFIDAFKTMGRGEQFSIPALRELFTFYDDLEDDTGEQIELDPIAICCDWAEMTLTEIIREYPDHVNLPVVYRYVIDLDERGEFHATVYQVNPNGTEVEKCNVSGDMLQEGGLLEGTDPHDRDNVVDELYLADLLEHASDDTLDASEEFDFREAAIDALRDHTTVLDVEHFENEQTYLVMAF